MGFLKNNVIKWLGLTNATMHPINEIVPSEYIGQRYSDKENEYWTWFTADSKKLINYYSNMKTVNGKRDYFWCVSAYEDNKKTHSGIPKAIIDTLCNVTGIPSFDSEDDKTKERMKEIIDFNDFTNIMKQEARAKTLVIGGGVFFVSNLKPINDMLDKPIIEFVDERFCDIDMIGNVFVSATKKTRYGDYTHLEKRSYNKIENTLINEKGNPVSFELVPELNHLVGNEIIELDIDMIPAIPCRYKNGVGRSYGMSIFEGKVDLFDDYDQTCSQIAEMVRLSTPIEYMPSELLEIDERTKKPLLPSTFSKKYQLLKRSMKQDDSNRIEHYQPMMNFDQILNVGVQQLIQIMTGVLAPASLGIEVQRNNNAEAMREKEKVTLVTRDDIIDNERGIIQRVIQLALRVYDNMEGKSKTEYEFSVDYPDFSTPTFDAIVTTILPLWANKAISPEEFVEMLHGDTLTEEAKEREIDYLKSQEVTVEPFNYGLE